MLFKQKQYITNVLKMQKYYINTVHPYVTHTRLAWNDSLYTYIVVQHYFVTSTNNQ